MLLGAQTGDICASGSTSFKVLSTLSFSLKTLSLQNIPPPTFPTPSLYATPLITPAEPAIATSWALANPASGKERRNPSAHGKEGL